MDAEFESAARFALVLMDFQRRPLARIEARDSIIQRVDGVRQVARQVGLQIVHVRVAFTAQDYACIPQRNQAFWPVVGVGASAEGTPDSSIVDDLTPEDGDFVVTKTRFGAFSTTNLHHMLQSKNINALILAGVSTSGAVLSTVRDAGDRDYELYVLSDCCADPDANLHELLMGSVISKQAKIIQSTELPKMFTR